MSADRFPATGVQRGIWLTQLLEPASPAYHISLVYRLTGDLDVEALQRAYLAVCNGHEALRSCFVAVDRRPLQEIRPAVRPALHRIDGTAPGSSDALVEAEFDRPFDLAAPPLLRMSLIRTAAREHLLVIVAHHLVADADTVTLVAQELSRRYRHELTAAAAPEPEAGHRYREYLAATQAWPQTAQHRRAVDFFRRRLDGCPPAIALPAPQPARSTWDGAAQCRTIAPEPTAALLSLGQRLRATPFVLLLSLYGVVLHGGSGQERVVVGTPVSLRDEPGLAGVAGMLVNPVPIPTRWHGEQPFGAAVEAVQDTVWDCLDHRRCPFEQLVAELRPARAGRRNPVFQVMFGFEEGAPPVPDLAGLAVERVATPPRSAKLELTLTATLHAGTIGLELEYNTGRVTAAAAAHLADELVRVAGVVASDPDVRVRDLLAR